MNDQTEQALSQPETKSAEVESRNWVDASYHEAPEIRGWALEWDTTELRKANLARKMRRLRQSPPDA